MVLISKDRILVPIDFSDRSLQALEDAIGFAEKASDIHVLHVLKPLEPTEPGVIWESVSDENRKANVQKLFSEKFSGDQYEALNFSIEVGDPTAEIIDYAETQNIGLIIMPSRGRTGISRFFMGSIAERVIRFAHCPVLVLKQ
ncbi:MAG: universal stress protein [Phormidesmis sp.]